MLPAFFMSPESPPVLAAAPSQRVIAYRLLNPKRRRASSKNIKWINNCLKNKQRYHFGSYHNGKLEILSRYLCFGLRHEEKEQNVE